MKKLTIALAAAGLLGMSTMSNAADKQFSADQKKQIQEVVHDYLLSNPNILVEVSQKLQEQQESQLRQMEQKAQELIPTMAKELFNSSTSPVVGNEKGNVTLVEFFDYQCGHCKNMSPVIKDLVDSDGNVRVVYKEFPIFGSSSVYASKAALAANMQGKYEAFHDKLIETSNPLTKEKIMKAAKEVGLNTKQMEKDMESKEVKQELSENLKLAQQLGIQGTPAFVLGHTTKGDSKDSVSFFIPGGTSGEILQQLVTQVRAGDNAS